MKRPMYLNRKIANDHEDVVPHGYRRLRFDAFAYLTLALLFVLLRMMGVL
jgi:hypothetical protein